MPNFLVGTVAMEAVGPCPPEVCSLVGENVNQGDHHSAFQVKCCAIYLNFRPFQILILSHTPCFPAVQYSWPVTYCLLGKSKNYETKLLWGLQPWTSRTRCMTSGTLPILWVRWLVPNSLMYVLGLLKPPSSQTFLWGRAGFQEPSNGVWVGIPTDLKVGENPLLSGLFLAPESLSWPVLLHQSWDCPEPFFPQKEIRTCPLLFRSPEPPTPSPCPHISFPKEDRWASLGL